MTLVKHDQLLSNKACVVLFPKEVGISGSHSLQINNVAPLVSASDSLDLYTASYLDLFALSIDQLVDLNVHLFTHLNHHFVELLLTLDSFLLVNSAILSEQVELRVVKNTGNDRLSNDSLSSIVNDSCRKSV